MGLFRNSPLWYTGNTSEFQYGFVESVNGTNGEIIEDTRNLVDNLEPITLLINNIPDFGYVSSTVDQVELMWRLINSSEFCRDLDNGGFFPDNQTAQDTKDVKNTTDNFRAILSNLLVYENSEFNESVRDEALEMAQTTMDGVRKLFETNYFKRRGDASWDSTPFNEDVFLDVQALAITTLIEYWLATGKTESWARDNATLLFNRMNRPANAGGMWNATYKAYEYRKNYDDINDVWEIKNDDLNARRLDLEATLS